MNVFRMRSFGHVYRMRKIPRWKERGQVEAEAWTFNKGKGDLSSGQGKRTSRDTGIDGQERDTVMTSGVIAFIK